MANTLTTETAAELLMKTPTFIRQLERDAWIKAVEKGRYELVDLIQGYIRYRDDQEQRQTKTAAAARIQDARAQDMEVRTMERQKKLVPTEDALLVVDEVTGYCRAEFSSLPARVTRDLELRDALEKEIDESFHRIADLLEQRAGSLRESKLPNTPGRPLNS